MVNSALKTRVILSAFFVLILASAHSQTISSAQNGTWNDVNTWTGGVIPTAANSDAIIIGHNINIPAAFSVTIDGTTINVGATLTVNPSGSLVIANAPAALTVDGTLRALQSSLITGSNGINVIFSNGSFYRHEFTTTEGRIPLASWDVNSTLEIVGYTTFRNATALGNWGQNFGNVTYNCAAQSQSFNFIGLLVSVGGDLNVLSTGTSTLIFSINQNPTVNIAGDFTTSGSSVIILSATGSNAIFNVAGDFAYNTNGSSYITTTGSTILNIAGNFTQSAGIFRLVGAGADGVGTINLSGNFTLSGGQITENGSNSIGIARGLINFVRDGVQTFTNTGTISNTIQYSVAVNSILDIQGESQVIGENASQFTLNGTVRVRSTAATGAITLGSGAGTGNIRTAARTYNNGSVISYMGGATQVVGNGHPVTAGVNMEINNANGVVLNTTSTLANLIIGGNLILTSGNLSIVSNGSARTLTINNTVSAVGANAVSFSGGSSHLVISGAGVADIPVANGSSMSNLTMNRPGGSADLSNNFTISGTTLGTGGNLIFSGVPTLSGPVTINAGSIDFNSGGTISGAVTLNAGTNIFFQGQTLQINNSFTSNGGGSLFADNASTLVLNGNPAFGILVFDPSGNTLGTLTINKTGSGAVATLNSALTITTAFNLLDGIFSHMSGMTMNNGATLIRDPNSPLVGSPPGGGPYSIVYVGANLTPGIEINGNFNNLTVNSTGIVSLSNPLTVPAQLTVNSGTLTTNTHAVNTNSLVINGGTFNAPTSTLTLTGNFTNNATFNHNNGTVVFNGNSTISGTGSKIFRNITVNAARTLNITNQTISIAIGNFTIVAGATFIPTNSNVQFTGAAVQSLSANGAGFNNITVNKTSGSVNLTSAVVLNGTLTIQSATTLSSNGNLTVASTTENTTQDGRIATLPPGAAVSGNVTVQRFMATADDVDRFISSPVTNAPVSQLQDDFPVTGSFTGSSYPCTGCNNDGGSLKWYNETMPGEFTLGYSKYPVNTNADQLVPGRGYAAYMWNGVAPTTIDVSGPINSGTVNFTVSHTFSTPANPDNDGWNLLGNPYPSAIAWNNGIGWVKNQIHSLVYVWDVDAAVYRTYDANTGLGDLTNGVIAMGQSFWVYALQPGASISINENAKTTSSGTFLRTRTSQSGLTISLAHKGSIDNSFIILRSKGDKVTDGRKLFGSEKFSIATVAPDGRKLVFYTVDEMGNDLRIPLFITARENGKYEISFSAIGDFNERDELYIEDAYLGTSSSITNPYAFEITENRHTYENRFFLTRSRGMADLETDLKIDLFPNPVNSLLTIEINTEQTESVYLTDSMGKIAGEIVMLRMKGKSRGQANMSNKPSGLYIVRTKANGKMLVRKIFKN